MNHLMRDKVDKLGKIKHIWQLHLKNETDEKIIKTLVQININCEKKSYNFQKYVNNYIHFLKSPNLFKVN